MLKMRRQYLSLDIVCTSDITGEWGGDDGYSLETKTR
jgi:hypothetical protein